MIKPSDLILVNEEGEVIDGGENRMLNLAAFMIHSAIHKARPDVNAAAHTHSKYGRTFSTLGKELSCTSQDACIFYQVGRMAALGEPTVMRCRGERTKICPR